MTAINDSDISNAELLEAVNNGFTAMQEQFNGLQQQVTELQETEAKHHAENQQDHEEMRGEIAALSKQLDQTIKVTDTHDQILQTFNR